MPTYLHLAEFLLVAVRAHPFLAFVLVDLTLSCLLAARHVLFPPIIARTTTHREPAQPSRPESMQTTHGYPFKGYLIVAGIGARIKRNLPPILPPMPTSFLIVESGFRLLPRSVPRGRTRKSSARGTTGDADQQVDRHLFLIIAAQAQFLRHDLIVVEIQRVIPFLGERFHLYPLARCENQRTMAFANELQTFLSYAHGSYLRSVLNNPFMRLAGKTINYKTLARKSQ